MRIKSPCTIPHMKIEIPMKNKEEKISKIKHRLSLPSSASKSKVYENS